jgi:membrane protease YdiL (CAAX protease family)
VGISTGRWLVVWAACAIGFLVLSVFPQPNSYVALVPRTLFVAIPLGALVWAAGPYWRAVFRRVRARDVGLMVLFAGLNIVVTSVVAAVVRLFVTVSANAQVPGGGPTTGPELAAFYVGTGVQLLGEELFTILPFLALLHLLVARAGLSRNRAVLLAWLITAVWFGAALLPTYDWNAAQAFLIIGSARLMLTLAYIRTKNLWVSTGAHVLNDWTLLTIPLLGGTAALLG